MMNPITQISPMKLFHRNLHEDLEILEVHDQLFCFGDCLPPAKPDASGVGSPKFIYRRDDDDGGDHFRRATFLIH